MLIEAVFVVDEASANALADALLDAGALSVAVEDADADTPDEQPIFGEPGMVQETQAWHRSRLVMLMQTEPGQDFSLALADLMLAVRDADLELPLPDTDTAPPTPSATPMITISRSRATSTPRLCAVSSPRLSARNAARCRAGPIAGREVILLHLAAQRVTVNTQRLGGFGLVATALLQHLTDVLGLELRHRILEEHPRLHHLGDQLVDQLFHNHSPVCNPRGGCLYQLATRQ